MAHKYFPINLSIRNRRALVVGGGTVALRKVDTLLDYDADVTVIAPEPNDKIEYYASKNKITLHQRAYQSPEAAGYGLVISASDDSAVNHEVYDDCDSAGVLVNIVDNPPLCSFTFPATVRRDCLSLAISTDGKAPFLAAHLRLILEEFFPQHWSKIARLAAEYRKLVQTRWGDDPDRRMAALERFLSADWKELVKEKDERELMDVLERLADPPAPADSN